MKSHFGSHPVDTRLLVCLRFLRL